MLTLNQMHSQIDEALNINSDDSIFDTRLYTDLIKHNRSVALRNEYNRNRKLDERHYIQTLACLPLEIVNSSTCCEGITNCKLLRTVDTIPSTIELHSKDGITSVQPDNILSKSLPYVEYDRVPYLQGSAFINTMIYAFLFKGHIYLFSKNPMYFAIESITVRGVFEDPVEAGNLSCNSNQEKGCFTEDSEYPISDWMWQTLVKPAVLQELLPKQYTKNDESNNAKDDKTEETIKTKRQ